MPIYFLRIGMEWNVKTDRHLWIKNNVHGCYWIFCLISLIIFYGMERYGKTYWHLWNKNNVHKCFSTFSLNLPNYFLQNRTEWNGTKNDIHLWNKNNIHGCISIFSMICLIIFYWTEWNGMEIPTDIFWIKTKLTVVSQSLAWSA